jgi:uncharacterized membrane-anchored protein YjiN (DUF445 family)
VPLRSERIRRRQLVLGKRRATGLLAGVAAVFVGVTLFGGGGTVAGYAQATAEASLVGGLADWFAVTALFRRPLGLPIPHTAIVVERKNQFASTLAGFIQESFLTPEVVTERIRTSGVVDRVGRWLADPANGRRLVGQVAEAASALVDAGGGDGFHHTFDAMLRDWAEAQPVAPLLGRSLRVVMEKGRHDAVVDRALRALDRYLDAHRQELRRQLLTQARWWLPGTVEDRIFDRLLDGARRLAVAMAEDHDHQLRRQLEARVQRFARELEESPAMRERAEQIKRELLAQPELRRWTASLWEELRRQLRAQASDPGSHLRRRLCDLVNATGHRLQHDGDLFAGVQSAAESAAVYGVEHFGAEITGIVSTTISRWNAADTANRLELLLGPDLQYIRINGTVVGAAAGLGLHAVAKALG